jgi:hypothetical protein
MKSPRGTGNLLFRRDTTTVFASDMSPDGINK